MHHFTGRSHMTGMTRTSSHKPAPVTRRTAPARTAKDTTEDPLMTTDQTAAYLATTTEALRSLRRRGAGPAYVKIGRVIRYRRSAVNGWLEKLTVHPKAS